MIHYTNNFEQSLRTILLNYTMKPINVIVSGGSMLPLLASTLKNNPNELNITKWNIYLADERITDDVNEKNYNQAIKYLQDYISADLIHPTDSLKHTSTIFDVALLSVGPDGHVASLFPDQVTLDNKENVVMVENAPIGPSRRMTVSLEKLNQVKKIIFFIPPKNGKVKDVDGPHQSITDRMTANYDIFLDEKRRK